jgi:ABC-2 type transport system permease protein
MHGIYTVFRREFVGYFRSAIAYVFLVVFVLLAIGLPWFLDNFLESDEASLQLFFRYLPWINVLFVPAVGMRLWSEERNSGTWELLLTLPFSTAQAVVGKFLAGWVFVGFGLLLTFPFPLTVAYLGQPDWGPILGGYGMGFLMSGAVLAICSLLSSLTQNQVVAFILGVLGCLVLNLTGWSVFNSILHALPVALADAINNFSFTTHFETARQGLVRFGDILFFGALIMGALVANVVVLQREATTAVGRKAAAIALVAASILLVNSLATRLPAQADLTREKFFTLSPASSGLLQSMTSPVQVELYFSGSRKGLPIGLKVFAQRVEQLLRQYERRSGGRVAVKVIDPIPGSRAEEEARRLGLSSQPLGPDERLYFGLAVFHGGNRRTIPLVDYRRERLLEHDITRLIAAVQTHHLPKLAIVSSLEVCGSRGMPVEQRKIEDGTAEWQFVRELRVSYEVTDVHPGDETLPGDTDILLVINPNGFDPRMIHAIDQFVLSGRPAVVLVDPYNYREVLRDETDGNVLGAEYFKRSDLPELLPAWGIHFAPREVVGDLAFPTEIPVQDNQPPIPFPVWITLPEFDDSQAVTAGFDSVLLAHAGHVEPLGGDAPAVRFTPLLRSSPRSGPLSADTIEKINPYRLVDEIKPRGEPYALAAMVEGRFRTAFPGGKPPPGEGRGTTGEPDPWQLGLRESKSASRVIVIADADFLHNEIAYAAVTRRGDSILARPRNNNVALLVNSLDYLGGAAAMLPIAAKGQTVRPFVRVHQLKRTAEDNFRDEVRKLNLRLAQIDEELVDLNKQAAAGGNSLVSEQALTAIRRAQKEQNGLRSRRSDIEHALQETIAALQQRLTVLNLAIVPGAIALGGIAFWLYRTRRRALV